ncbi:MAG: ABC transporter ATP-binding protein [Promethearchaeota archaeon]
MISVNIESKEFLSAQDESTEVLSGLAFDIHPHDLITIVGPSGCGKTTLLRIIAGFDDDFSGKIDFGSDRTDSSDSLNSSDNHNSKYKSKSKSEEFSRLGKIGYIPQEFSLFPWLTVKENIEFGLNLQKIPKKSREETTTRLLEAVSMGEFKNFYPKEISGGMKQKIAICRALAINPESNLIMMDEPFSALDAQARNKLQRDLIKIWKEQNLTILFITHNVDEAVFLSTRVLVMSSMPAKIVHEEKIMCDHPRDRTSLEFNTIRRRILSKEESSD